MAASCLWMTERATIISRESSLRSFWAKAPEQSEVKGRIGGDGGGVYKDLTRLNGGFAADILQKYLLEEPHSPPFL